MPFGICCLGWWPELLVFSSQKGAVTAEFMLLFPTVVLALAGTLGVFQLGVAQLSLSREAFLQARQLAIGNDPEASPDVSLTERLDGRFVCVSAVRNYLFELKAEVCLPKHGL